MGDSTPCDCHVHVFDPPRYPYSPSRKFTPDLATTEQLTQYLGRAGMVRVVLVQPSVYGTDNRCMVDAIGRLGSRAKGVAVVSEDADAQALAELSAAGVVGARLNLVVNRSNSGDDAQQALARLDAVLPQDWHIQLHVSLQVLSKVARHIRQSRRRFVLDHLGLPSLHEGVKAPAWRQVLELVRTERFFVKLSGPYLTSRTRSPYLDLRPFVESLAQTSPASLLWGSNWPHTQGIHRSESDDPFQIEKFRPEDDQAWHGACAQWLGLLCHEHMHSNAARVYGFTPEEAA